jgi:hypothetical protein
MDLSQLDPNLSSAVFGKKRVTGRSAKKFTLFLTVFLTGRSQYKPVKLIKKRPVKHFHGPSRNVDGPWGAGTSYSTCNLPAHMHGVLRAAAV